MMIKRLAGWLAILILAIQATGCGVSPMQITPYDPELSTALAAYTQMAKNVKSPTFTLSPRFSPTSSHTITQTVSATLTSSPTLTLSPTPSQTDTPVPVVKLNVMIATCDTGVDIFHKLGEVTNAYVMVQNVGNADATGVQATLSASDEQKPHPDKTYLVQNLPAGEEIPLKLTVDTKEGVDTSITVDVTSAEEVSAKAEKASCSSRIAQEDIINLLGKLFVVRKIVKP
jgi:VCBS repeat-containing protein